ncbi:uncharacterized protein LOC142582943 [Dermacentor variabilis]|uniref:uncharacterized protein LOC142582943 n=1 Tax=Dermacentor variabilis TaxID=34621 RepID=UPI003F5BEB12
MSNSNTNSPTGMQLPQVVKIILKERCIVILLIVSCLFRATNAECPSACFCDSESQYVSCVGDSTSQAPQDLPRPSERLELRNFAVDVLAQHLLSGVPALKELKLQQSRTRAVEDGALAELALLQRLDLSQNLLENLTSGTFKGLQQLKYLDLSSNQLAHIDGAFSGLGNLEQLNLHSNLLTQLNTYTFTGLHQIQYLNLDSNLVSSLEVGAFQNLPNLGHLILSNNPLTSLSRLNFFGSRLQYIDASHVGLERIPQSLTRYVRDLRLSRNNITHITLGDLDSYPHLGLLVLDDNAIEDVEDDALGRQEYLARLWLNGNRLTRVPMNLPQMLVALYIEENLITELPANSFFGLSKLEQLYLQRNQIRNISESALSDLVNLKTLDLQANLIQVLPNHVFSNLSNLQTLDISQNLLQLLEPECFQGLDALQTLQVSRIANKVEFQEYVFDPLKALIKLEMYDSSGLVADIIKSPRTLHGLRNVQELNIMHNKLTDLRPDFPSFFPKLKVLKVGGNMFHCGPEVRWLSEWIKTSSIQFYSSYSIRCASPVTLQFKPVMLLKEEDFVEITTQTPPTPQGRSAALVKRVPLLNVPEPISASEGLTAIVTFPPSTLRSITTRSRSLEAAEPTAAVSSNQTGIFPADSETAPMSTEDFFQTPQTQKSLNITAQMAGNQKASNESLIAHLASNVTSSTDGTITDSMSDVTIPTVMSKPITTTILNSVWQLPTAETAVPALTTAQDNHTSLSFNAPQRLLLAPPVAEKQQQEPSTEGNSTVTSRIITGCSFLLFVTLVTTVFLLQTRHNCMGCREHYSRIQRSSIISYRPQHDEVNILTVSEGTVDARTSMHRGIRNKLYFAVEGGGPHDMSNEPHLQELIPRSLSDSEWCSGHVCI